MPIFFFFFFNTVYIVFAFVQIQYHNNNEIISLRNSRLYNNIAQLYDFNRLDPIRNVRVYGHKRARSTRQVYILYLQCKSLYFCTMRPRYVWNNRIWFVVVFFFFLVRFPSATRWLRIVRTYSQSRSYIFRIDGQNERNRNFYHNRVYRQSFFTF